MTRHPRRRAIGRGLRAALWAAGMLLLGSCGNDEGVTGPDGRALKSTRQIFLDEVEALVEEPGARENTGWIEISLVDRVPAEADAVWLRVWKYGVQDFAGATEPADAQIRIRSPLTADMETPFVHHVHRQPQTTTAPVPLGSERSVEYRVQGLSGRMPVAWRLELLGWSVPVEPGEPATSVTLPDRPTMVHHVIEQGERPWTSVDLSRWAPDGPTGLMTRLINVNWSTERPGKGAKGGTIEFRTAGNPRSLVGTGFHGAPTTPLHLLPISPEPTLEYRIRDVPQPHVETRILLAGVFVDGVAPEGTGVHVLRRPVEVVDERGPESRGWREISLEDEIPPCSAAALVFAEIGDRRDASVTLRPGNATLAQGQPRVFSHNIPQAHMYVVSVDDGGDLQYRVDATGDDAEGYVRATLVGYVR